MDRQALLPRLLHTLLGKQKGAWHMDPKKNLDVDDLIYQDEWQISQR